MFHRVVIRDPARRPPSSPLPPSGTRPALRYALRFDGRALPLGYGVFILGRSASADYRVDGTAVSRQHARLTVSDQGVFIEDLSSRNGLFVNDVLVRRSVPLDPGDRIRLGDREVVLDGRPPGTDDQVRLSSPSGVDSRSETADDPTTGRADPVTLLGTVVDSALESGDPGDAEALVSKQLQRMLADARRERSLPAESCQVAADSALKLAEATGKGTWIDYAVELYLTSRRLVPLKLVRDLFRIAPRVRATDPSLVRRYLAWARSQTLDAEQRVVVARLARFSRL